MQQNQVYVIQVNTNNSKIPLALPPPAGTLLPSEVKYSASLVRGLGGAHLVLGVVLFLLGVLGSWVEPETCWSGAGVWGGIATIICGTCGVLAYHLWYKNYTIKAFLVSSVVCFVISILAIILIIYALVNRHEQFYNLLQEAESKPWFKPYNTDQEHQLTVSVSANLLVGFVLEFILAVWSVKIGWRGVRAEEFSTSRRDALPDDLQSIVSTTQPNGQQVPLAALYQLLQAHPELLGSKTAGGGLGPPWLSSLDDRPSHRSMDYQERVSRFLSHAIEDQNPSFSRSPSTIQEDIQENASPTGGRGSPSSSADTAVVLPDPSQSNPTDLSPTATFEKPSKVEDQHIAKIHTTKVRNGEPKSRAPLPKEIKEIKEKEYRNNKSSQDCESVVQDDKESHANNVSEKSEEKEQRTKKKSKEKTSVSTESQQKDDKDKASTSDRDAYQSSQTERIEKQNKKEKEQNRTSTDNGEKDHSASAERSEKQKSKKVKEHDEVSKNDIDVDQSKKSEIKGREQDNVNTNDVDQSKQSENTERKKSKREKEHDNLSKNDADESKQTVRTEKQKSKRKNEQDHISKSDIDQSRQSENIEKHKNKKEKERDQVSTNDVDKGKHSERTEKQKSKTEKELEEMNTGNVDESKQLEKSEKKKRKKEKEQNEASIPSMDAHQSGDADKSEKHKSKKEKQSHINEDEPEGKYQDNERREKKKHKKSEKHGKSKGHTSVTNDSKSEPSDIPEVIKTEAKSNANKSDSHGQNKDVTDHIIALKPPSEFQDVDLKVKS